MEAGEAEKVVKQINSLSHASAQGSIGALG